MLTKTFSEFFHSEKSSAVVLMVCTLLSLGIANSASGAAYLAFWQTPVAGLSIEH
jgi:Na+:H+ antiporter, NhaA family